MKEKLEDITLTLAAGHGESCAIDGMGILKRWKPFKKGKPPKRADPTKLSVTAGVAKQLRANPMFVVAPGEAPGAEEARKAHAKRVAKHIIDIAKAAKESGSGKENS